jgi:hypothetical protein
MRACPQCQRTYPDDPDFCPRDAALHSFDPPRRGGISLVFQLTDETYGKETRAIRFRP